MLALIETLFDIIRLRKGPDAIPHSQLLFVIVVALWLFAGTVMTVLTVELGKTHFFEMILVGVAGLLGYAAIVLLSGHGARALQTVTALLGCDSLLSLVYVAAIVFLAPYFSGNLVSIVVTVILIWSLVVEGHIIARAIDQRIFVGVVAAVVIFLFQQFLFSAIDSSTAVAT